MVTEEYLQEKLKVLRPRILEYSKNVTKGRLRSFDHDHQEVIDYLLSYVSFAYKIEEELITSKRQNHDLACARSQFIYLVKRTFPNAVLKLVASLFGKNEHTVIISSLQRYQDYLGCPSRIWYITVCKDVNERIEKEIFIKTEGSP
jgi:chromosomal replication initiation ATPase DnaA